MNHPFTFTRPRAVRSRLMFAEGFECFKEAFTILFLFELPAYLKTNWQRLKNNVVMEVDHNGQWQEDRSTFGDVFALVTIVSACLVVVALFLVCLYVKHHCFQTL